MKNTVTLKAWNEIKAVMNNDTNNLQIKGGYFNDTYFTKVGHTRRINLGYYVDLVATSKIVKIINDFGSRPEYKDLLITVVVKDKFPYSVIRIFITEFMTAEQIQAHKEQDAKNLIIAYQKSQERRKERNKRTLELIADHKRRNNII